MLQRQQRKRQLQQKNARRRKGKIMTRHIDKADSHASNESLADNKVYRETNKRAPLVEPTMNLLQERAVGSTPGGRKSSRPPRLFEVANRATNEAAGPMRHQFLQLVNAAKRQANRASNLQPPSIPSFRAKPKLRLLLASIPRQHLPQFRPTRGGKLCSLLSRSNKGWDLDQVLKETWLVAITSLRKSRN